MINKLLVQDVLSSYPPDQWVFWVGAGVSCPSLPLGRDLTQFVLEQVLGLTPAHALLENWSRFNQFAASVSSESPGDMPRLEAVLEQVFGVEGDYNKSSFQFSKGFSGWRNIPPTSQHYELAQLIKAGSAVVTVNFDTGIKDAFEEVAGRPLVLQPIGDLPAFVDSAGSGRLVHLHGIIEESSTLVATVRRMLAGIPEAFSGWIAGKLSGGVALIFAGYGALDSFDVTPFFARPSISYPQSAAVYFSHESRPLPRAVSRLLQPFGRSGWDGGPTDSMLAAATRMLSLRPKRTLHRSPARGWREAFLGHARLDARDVVKGYLVLGLCQSLGLSPNGFYPTAFSEALLYRGQFTEDKAKRRQFHWRLGIVYRSEDDLLKETWWYLKGGFSSEAFTSWMNARGIRCVPAVPAPHVLRTRFDRAAADGVALNWDFSTLLSARCEMAFRRNLQHKRGRSNSNSIRELIHLLDEFINREFIGVEYGNQQALALRKRALLNATQGISPETDIRKAMLLYSDTTSLDGFIGSYRDMARATTALKGIRSIPDSESLDWARNAVLASQILGNRRQQHHSERVLAKLGG